MPKINIGGQERYVKYTINAVIEFEELTGIDVTKGSPDFGRLSSMRALAYVGLKHGALAQGKTVDFDLNTVGAWMSFGDDSIVQFIKAFQNDSASDEVSTEDTDKKEDPKK